MHEKPACTPSQLAFRPILLHGLNYVKSSKHRPVLQHMSMGEKELAHLA